MLQQQGRPRPDNSRAAAQLLQTTLLLSGCSRRLDPPDHLEVSSPPTHTMSSRGREHVHVALQGTHLNRELLTQRMNELLSSLAWSQTNLGSNFLAHCTALCKTQCL